MVGRAKLGPKGTVSAKKSKVIVRRSGNKIYGLFVDGIGLDRASKRLQKKVDLPALAKSLTSGQGAEVARYYTLLPVEDDSRHRSFLEAVSKAGFDVFSKRLPPKGIERQVSTDVELASDMISFALGTEAFSDLGLVSAGASFSIMPKASMPSAVDKARPLISPSPADTSIQESLPSSSSEGRTEEEEIKRVIVVVCPGRDLSYPLALCRHLGADTISADFGQFIGKDPLKSAAKWIDLTDSQPFGSHKTLKLLGIHLLSCYYPGAYFFVVVNGKF